MASTSGGGHGGKRSNSGRKKKVLDNPTSAKKEWFRRHKRIYIEENIFKSWLEAKFVARYDSCSDSMFMEHLLSQEYQRRTLEENSDMVKQRRVIETDASEDEVLRNTQSKSVPSDSTITTTVDKDTNILHEHLTSLEGETPMQVSVEEFASPKESSDQNSQLPEQTSAEFVVLNVVKYNKRKHSIPRKICAKKAEVSEESKSPVLLMDEKQEQKTVGSGAATVDSEQDSDENSDVEVKQGMGRHI